MSSKTISDYRQTLVAIREVLADAYVREWVPALDRWIDELKGLSAPSAALCDHLHRSWFATGGMGSLGDVVIAAGQEKSVQGVDRLTLDAKLQGLVRQLYDITTELSIAWSLILSRARNGPCDQRPT